MLLWQSYLFGWSGGKGKKHGDIVSYVYSTVGSYSRPTKLLWRGESPLLAWGTIASFSISYYSSTSSFLLLAAQKINALFIFICLLCVAFIHYVVLLQ